MSLFEKGDFIMHSGGEAHYKIECDYLVEEDYDCLAYIVISKSPIKFRSVHGVPSGGLKFAAAIDKYIDHDPNGIDLIVDDVLTTGASMVDYRDNHGLTNAKGCVIFARGECPDWIHPIFSMHWFNTMEF